MFRDRDLYQDMTEAERRIANVAILARVVKIDPQRARVKVKAGPLESNWLPWTTPRAGKDRLWWMPEEGEQVLVIAPGGDLEQGVVVGSLFQQAFPPPADRADIMRIVWQDGTTVEYDRASHKLTVHCVGAIEITATGPVSVTAPSVTLDSPQVWVTGHLTVGDGIAVSGGGGSAAAISGDVAVEGSISASGSIMDAGGNSNHHSH